MCALPWLTCAVAYHHCHCNQQCITVIVTAAALVILVICTTVSTTLVVIHFCESGLLQVVERAQKEDLQHPQKYLVAFMRNSRDQIVIDRRFNTAQLMGMYLDRPVPEDDITWNPDNPNQLRMNIPGAQQSGTAMCTSAPSNLHVQFGVNYDVSPYPCSLHQQLRVYCRAASAILSVAFVQCSHIATHP